MTFANRCFVLMGSLSLVSVVAMQSADAQGLVKENIPAGVEARPSEGMVPPVTRSAPKPPPPPVTAPAPAMSATGAAKPITDAAPAAPSATKPGDKKAEEKKKFWNKNPPKAEKGAAAPAPRMLVAPGSTPAAGGVPIPAPPTADESKPGAVERAPAPKAPPQ